MTPLCAITGIHWCDRGFPKPTANGYILVNRTTLYPNYWPNSGDTKSYMRLVVPWAHWTVCPTRFISLHFPGVDASKTSLAY